MGKKPTGLIKTSPQSFVVQELVGKNKDAIPFHKKTDIKGFGKSHLITVFDLVKRGLASDQAMRQVARQLGVDMSSISMYGMKDRHALTAQMIGVEGEFTPRFSHDDIILCQTGQRDRPLVNGHNAGNRFKIEVITGATDIDEDVLSEFQNYFGQQRFGRFDTSQAGRFLLEGDYTAAASELSSKGFLPPQLKKLIRLERSWKKAFLNSSMRFQTGMYVLQWQSHLWNTLLAELDDPPDYLSVWRPESEEVVDLYRHLWDPNLPELLENNSKIFERLHRFDRPTLVRPKNIKVERKMVGWEFCFDLPSGAYATVALSQLFDLREDR